MRLARWNMFMSCSNCLLTVQRRASFVDHFCYLCFVLVYILSYLFLAASRSPAGKGLISWFYCMWCFLVFLPLSHMMPLVRCGYVRFLTFVFFLILACSWNHEYFGSPAKLTGSPSGLHVNFARDPTCFMIPWTNQKFDLFFIVAPVICWGYVFGHCFVT